ncbi:MAG: DUF1631 family protein [Pseudomonadales bacterium]
MKNIQNFMLRELQTFSDDFCRVHLIDFFRQFESKNEQLSALFDQENDTGSGTSMQPEQQSLRQFVLEKRNKARFEQFESAFLTSINNTYAEFADFLNQRDSGEEISKELERVIESELALPNMINAAALRSEALLGALNSRLSVISQMKVTAERNPFTPLSFAHAFERSITSLHWNLQTRILAFRLFDASFLRQLNELYEQMNGFLVEQGILPNLRDSQQNQDHARSTLLEQQQQAAREHDKQHDSFEEASVAEQPASIANVARHQESAPIAADAIFTPAANEALQDDNIQAIEAVGQLFNELLSHEAMNSHIKSLLSRLYTPYVRLALSDDTLANNPDHPAQRLLQTLTRAIDLYQSKAAPLQRPALLLQIKSVVEQLSAQSELRPRVFSELAFRFSAELRHHDRLIHAHLDKKKRCQTGLRQLDSLRLSVRRIAEAKIQQAQQPVPDLVVDFLYDTWVQYVTSLYTNRNDDPEVAENCLNLIDRIIIYSVGGEGQSETEFTELAPQLRHGILACGGEGLEVRHFLQQLMHHHKNPGVGTYGQYQNTAMEAKAG